MNRTSKFFLNLVDLQKLIIDFENCFCLQNSKMCVYVPAAGPAQGAGEIQTLNANHNHSVCVCSPRTLCAVEQHVGSCCCLLVQLKNSNSGIFKKSLLLNAAMPGGVPQCVELSHLACDWRALDAFSVGAENVFAI